MAQKDNQRVRRTKQLLAEALTEMLTETSIHDVSIVELCEKAGINRTTFYYHYGNQYDLLEEISDTFLDEVSQRLASAEPYDRESVLEKVTMVFSFMEERIQLSRLLMNNMIDPDFVYRILSLPEIPDLLGVYYNAELEPDLQYASDTFTVFGSYRLLQLWINDDHRKSAAEEAAMVLDLARKVYQQ
ncbi:MAG: TetR/AcrR family transcriptional regulator [Solobacterium sp.]|nr:TetR/AcrR family transcriptional regulator [Solobacterium sp.]